MDDRDATRRRLLATVSGTTIPLLAGCLGLGDVSPTADDVPTTDPRPDREITAQDFVLIFTVSADSDWLEPYVPPHGTDDGPKLATMRPIVETPAGKRVGIDPETGDFVQEVEAADVSGAGRDRTVMILGHTRLDVTISGAALLRTIRAHGHDPETVPYDLRVMVDTDPSIERTEEGIIYHGRATHELERTTDDPSPVLAHADVRLDPWSIDAEPADEPVWALVALEDPFDPADIDVDSVHCNDVSVVDDHPSTPTVVERDGREWAAFRFPRDELAGLLDPGPHEVSVSGIVGDSVFVGLAPFDVEE